MQGYRFWTGICVLPIPQSVLEALECDSGFTSLMEILDLGTRLLGNPDIESAAFLNVLQQDVDKITNKPTYSVSNLTLDPSGSAAMRGSQLCATMCILHELLRLQIVSLDTVRAHIMGLRGPDRQKLLLRLLTSQHQRVLTDVYTSLLNTLVPSSDRDGVVLHTFTYDKARDELAYSGSTGKVEVDGDGWERLNHAKSMYIVNVSSGHFVVAKPMLERATDAEWTDWDFPLEEDEAISPVVEPEEEKAPSSSVVVPRTFFVSWNTWESTVVPSVDTDDYGAKAKTRPALSKNSASPSAFLKVFGTSLMEFAAHMFIAVHQTHEEQLLKKKLTSLIAFPEETNPVCVDMDFAENYEIVHKVEVQSEHWSHQQVTLYIVIVHFRYKLTPEEEDDAPSYALRNEAHVFVSSDMKHDTYFVQFALRGLVSDFERRGMNLL